MTVRPTEPRGFRAYLTRPHDGDSFYVLADTLFRQRYEPELRLLDVHAPETRGVRLLRLPRAMQPGAQETTDFVNGWLAAAQAAAPRRRWWLWLETILSTAYEPEQRRTLDRYLATVWAFDRRGPEDSLNHAVTEFLAGHPDWPSGD